MPRERGRPHFVHSKNAENGQIVVALVDEYEVTLKMLETMA